MKVSEFRFQVYSIVRAHHVSKVVELMERRQIVFTNRRIQSLTLRYTVAVMVDEVTIEHVPREVSKHFYYLLKGSSNILVTYCNMDLSKLEGYDEIRAHLYKFSMTNY